MSFSRKTPVWLFPVAFSFLFTAHCGSGQTDSGSIADPRIDGGTKPGQATADAAADDAAPVDAGTTDEALDANVETHDAGSGDMGSPKETDAGSSAPEDAGPFSLVADCLATLDEIYSTPTSADETAPGAILRCAVDGAWNLGRDELSNALMEPATSDTLGYRLSYRTSRNYPDAIGVVGSARVLIPTRPARRPLPIVVVNHGTVGVADVCAPSRRSAMLSQSLNSATQLALSFAAIGYAVIAPDYAGMGTEGVQGYGDGVDTAYSALDAARALRAMFAEGSLSNDVLMTGHSQGGGATFEAVALAPSYAPELQISAAGVFSGRYASGDAELTRLSPNEPIGANAFALVLSLYATVSNLAGEARALEIFNAQYREELGQHLTNACAFDLQRWLEQNPATISELLDGGFLRQYNRCALDHSTCTGLTRLMLMRRPTHTTLTGSSAPVLMVVGDKDELNPPSKVACSYENAEADGASFQLCVTPDSSHASIVPELHAFVRTWLLNRFDGKASLSCPAGTHTGPTALCR
ncbi:MAG: alpha/beta fold hydrolase [Deltaproteobacteria bacterium]|nr:alpha/beta fold hydrolase [Deltaproteobacteria bacterium]